MREYAVTDFAYARYRAIHGPNASLPLGFMTATAISPFHHLDMQAALQSWVDDASSKTINVPEDYPFDDFKLLYEYAFEKALKGCTTFRPNPLTGQVLVQTTPTAPQCCSVEREAD